MIVGFNTPIPTIDRLDKQDVFESIFTAMINKLLMMFEYQGIPEYMDIVAIEKQLFYYGTVGVFQHDGKLYGLNGGLGGEPNEYYLPTLYTIANPYLKISKSYNIGVDCVMIGNDSMYYGLKSMLVRYATQLTENIITMQNMDITNRAPVGIAAPDDRTYKSALNFFNDIYNGKFGVMSDNKFLDGINSIPLHSQGGSHLTDEIELHQYLKASWYNEIGLKSNYNMKRESINADEAQLDNTSLLPLAEDMLMSRKRGWDKVNAMFGTNIVVDFSDIWKKSVESLNNSNMLEMDDDVEENEEDNDDSN